jgi:hypothetical protein
MMAAFCIQMHECGDFFLRQPATAYCSKARYQIREADMVHPSSKVLRCYLAPIT